MSRCLYCYQPLTDGEADFHPKCCKKIFGLSVPPILPYDETQMMELGLQVIQNQIAVTGVQPKISLHLNNEKKRIEPHRFTIVGLWGGYILKPPSVRYPEIVEVESLTMHLANLSKIKVVPHALIRLKSGQLAYITKRIDRINGKKLHMEDMCQLTDRMAENKYQASYEQIAKAIYKHSSMPGLDVVNFYEQVLFSFLTGNADMHLKNFSLIYGENNKPVLSPGYDMLSTAIVNPADEEELALTLNGKKKKIRRNDFITAFTTSKLDTKQQENIFRKMKNAREKWVEMIDSSFLSEEFKMAYKSLIEERFSRLCL